VKLGIAGRFCPSMQLINSFGEGVTQSGEGDFRAIIRPGIALDQSSAVPALQN